MGDYLHYSRCVSLEFFLIELPTKWQELRVSWLLVADQDKHISSYLLTDVLVTSSLNSGDAAAVSSRT